MTKLDDYFREVFRPSDPILELVRESARVRNWPDLHLSESDGLHLEVLTRLSSARVAVEIGAFCGYSSICIARGLPADGKLYSLELNPEQIRVARENYEKAGVAQKIESIPGIALRNLPLLASQGPFDLVYIDADKVNYPHYLEWARDNLRSGGLLVADNVFAQGEVWKESSEKPTLIKAARGLRQFNAKLAQDPAFRATLFPTGEGLAVAVKLAR